MLSSMQNAIALDAACQMMQLANNIILTCSDNQLSTAVLDDCLCNISYNLLIAKLPS